MALTNRERLNEALFLVDEQNARIAELERKLDLVVNPPEPPEPEPEKRYSPDGLKRDALGKVMPHADALTYDERLAERIEREDSEQAKIKKWRTKGLPRGQFRDPTGIIRDKQGKVVSTDHQNDDEVMSEMAKEQRWRREEIDRSSGRFNNAK